MKYISSLKRKNLQLQLEKLIVGVEEPIFIKGIGEINAKVDSGNGAYNVLHGEDFYYQGNTVIFTTYDDNNIPHKVSKKIQDKLTINIGAGHTEDRPVVLMDVKFADGEYTNVPFTIGNRANNKNKVLLGKEFLTKQLDVLIDVNRKNIANQKIEVETPINEASADEGGAPGVNRPGIGGLRYMAGQQGSKDPSSGNPSGATSTLGKAGKVAKGVWQGFMGLTDKNTKFFGKGGSLDRMVQGYKNAIDEIQKSDKYIIFKELNTIFTQAGQPIAPFVDNPQVFKVLDYMGNDYENENNLSQSEQPSEQEKKQPEYSVTPVDIPDEIRYGAEAEEEIMEAAEVQQNRKLFQKALEDVAKDAAPILYLVIFRGDRVEDVKKVLKNNYQNFKGSFNSMMKDIKNEFYSSTATALAQTLTTKLKEAGILSNFALVSGRGANRKAKFLASNFAPSLQMTFINQYPKNYREELWPSSKGTPPIDAFEGKFVNNKFFGFNNFKSNKNFGMGLPEEEIQKWIDAPSEDAHNGFNVKKAWEKFIKSNGNISETPDISEYTDQAKQEEKQEEKSEQVSQHDELENIQKNIEIYYGNINNNLAKYIDEAYSDLRTKFANRDAEELIQIAKNNGIIRYIIHLINTIDIKDLGKNPQKEIINIAGQKVNNIINKINTGISNKNKIYKLKSIKRSDFEDDDIKEAINNKLIDIEEFKNSSISETPSSDQEVHPEDNKENKSSDTSEDSPEVKANEEPVTEPELEPDSESETEKEIEQEISDEDTTDEDLNEYGYSKKDLEEFINEPDVSDENKETIANMSALIDLSDVLNDITDDNLRNKVHDTLIKRYIEAIKKGESLDITDLDKVNNDVTNLKDEITKGSINESIKNSPKHLINELVNKGYSKFVLNCLK